MVVLLFADFFFNIMFLFCVFVLCAVLYFRFGIQRCVSVSYSRVSVLGLGFPFWLACFCFEFIAFCFRVLWVICQLQYRVHKAPF